MARNDKWVFGKKKLSFEKPVIMGVLNITPDSFSDGGLFVQPKVAVLHAKKMISEGADIIDVGGESSRPGAVPISAEQELQRVLPVIKELKNSGAIISIDTTKPEVAQECLKHGANIINDITGFSQKKMVAVAKEFDAGAVVMHMKGNPGNMQQNPQYDDVVVEVKEFLAQQVKLLKKSGVERVCVDPGIGFGKTIEHNLELLARLNEFSSIGVPICVGTSRKSFIGKITGEEVGNRLFGTIASNVLALNNGASVFRVHDVLENKNALEVAHRLISKGE